MDKELYTKILTKHYEEIITAEKIDSMCVLFYSEEQGVFHIQDLHNSSLIDFDPGPSDYQIIAFAHRSIIELFTGIFRDMTFSVTEKRGNFELDFIRKIFPVMILMIREMQGVFRMCNEYNKNGRVK